jgi:hypothetical protein
VCRYGDYGDEFYLILQGSVLITSAKTAQVQVPRAFEALARLMIDCEEGPVDIPLFKGGTLSLKKDQVIIDKHLRHIVELCVQFRHL